MRAVALRALCAVLLVAALGPACAQAAEVPNHPFLGGLLGGAETPAGSFEDACGVAVDSQGDIYVSDYYHHAIAVFSEDGIYLTQITGVDPLDGPCGLAVDPAGRLYVNDYHRDVVRYTPSAYPYPLCPKEFKVPRKLCGPAPTYAPATVIDASHPTGLALDPATNNLYVNERTYIAAYKPSGEPVLSGGEPLKIGLGSLTDAYGVAISAFPATKGRVYVAEGADDTVKVFDPAVDLEDPVEVIDGAGSAQGGFVSLHDSSLAIDNSNGHLFVSDNTQPGFEHPTAVIDEFGASGLYRGSLEHAIVHGEPVGIAVDEAPPVPNGDFHKGDVYVTSGNGSSNVFPKAPNPEESVLYAFGPAGTSRTLTVSKSGAGQGTVMSKPAGISCGGACEAEFNSGGSVTLTATPAPGSAFAGWSGACSGTGSCQLGLGADVAVSAEFAPAPPSAFGLGSGVGDTQGAQALSTAASAAKVTNKDRRHRAKKHRRAKGKGSR